MFKALKISLSCSAVLLLASVAAAQNALQSENALPGDPAWELVDPAFNREIEAYANQTSVAPGGSIKFYVSTASTKTSMAIYRVGWYGGVGGRRLVASTNYTTAIQPMPAPDANGLVDAKWKVTATVNVPIATPGTSAAWTSGFYVAKFTQVTGGKQTYVPFVVREDNRKSDVLFLSGTNTYQAYNTWGGRGFYSSPRAFKESFNRPYQRSYGAGDFLNWEVQMVRFLEKEGYDVTYAVNQDLHNNRCYQVPHKVTLLVGHDEYWTWEMRENLEAQLGRGMSLANFGANACYWQARYEPDSAGTPDRTLVCYKYDASASDPILANGTKYPWANFFYQSRLTATWRDPIINRPEARFLGTQYHGDPFYGDITVTNTAHWIYKNTGLKDNDKLTGLLGYELDTVDPSGPSNLAILAASPDTWGTSNMTYYEHRGGGGVFSTGSMNFVWGLDNYPSAWVWPPVNYVTPKAQQMVRNVLYRMTTGLLP